MQIKVRYCRGLMDGYEGREAFLCCQLALFAECQIIRRGKRKSERERERKAAKSISGRNARSACASVASPEIPCKHIARHTGAFRRTERTGKTRERIRRQNETSWDTVRFGTRPRGVSVSGSGRIGPVQNRTHLQGTR